MNWRTQKLNGALPDVARKIFALRPNRNRGSLGALAASVTMSSALGVFSQSGALAADNVADNNGPGAPIREWTASIRWENDTFGGTDRFYTDGFSLGVSHTGPSWMDPVANWLPWGEGRRTVGYDIAQGMFTPKDIDRRVPDRMIARMPGFSQWG